MVFIAGMQGRFKMDKPVTVIDDSNRMKNNHGCLNRCRWGDARGRSKRKSYLPQKVMNLKHCSFTSKYLV